MTTFTRIVPTLNMSETDISSQSGRLSLESPDTSLSEDSLGYDYLRIAGTALDADRIPLHERLRRRARRPVKDGPRRAVRDGHWHGRLDEDNKIRGDTWAPGDREAALEWGRKRDLQRRAADRRDSVSSSNDGESSIEFGSDVSLTDQLTGYLDNAFGLGDTPDRGHVSVGEAREIKADVRSSLVASLDGSFSTGSPDSAQHGSDSYEAATVEEYRDAAGATNQCLVDGQNAGAWEGARPSSGPLTSHPPNQVILSRSSADAVPLRQEQSPIDAGRARATSSIVQVPNLSPVSEASFTSQLQPFDAVMAYQRFEPDLQAYISGQQQQGRPLVNWVDLASYKSSLSGSSSPPHNEADNAVEMMATVNFRQDHVAGHDQFAAAAATVEPQDARTSSADGTASDSILDDPDLSNHVLPEPGDYDYTKGSEIPLERGKGTWLPKVRRRGRQIRKALFSAAPTSTLSRSQSHVSSADELSVSGRSIISAEGHPNQRPDDGARRDDTRDNRNAQQSEQRPEKRRKPRRPLPWSGLLKRRRRPSSTRGTDHYV